MQAHKSKGGTRACAHPIFGAISSKIVVVPTQYFESYFSCAHPIFDTFLRACKKFSFGTVSTYEHLMFHYFVFTAFLHHIGHQLSNSIERNKNFNFHKTFLESLLLMGYTKCLLGYILGVLMHTTAWDQNWRGNEMLKLVLINQARLYFT